MVIKDIIEAKVSVEGKVAIGIRTEVTFGAKTTVRQLVSEPVG